MAVGLVDDDQVLQVLAFLDPASAALVRATSRSSVLAKVADGDTLWQVYMKRVFGLSGSAALVCPDGEAVSAPTAAFARWHKAASKAGLKESFAQPLAEPLCARWVAAWSRLQEFFADDNDPVATLRPPVEAGTLEELDAMMDGKVSPLVRGLWTVHDGQQLPREMVQRLRVIQEPSRAREADMWDGLFGGYKVYDHGATCLLLPLKVAMKATQILQNQAAPVKKDHPTKLIFACDVKLQKLIFVDTADGMVYIKEEVISPGNRTLRLNFVRAVPPGGQPMDEDSAKEGLEVRLGGLKDQPNLNSQLGVLGAFDATKGRWQVKLKGTNTTMLIKRDNLMHIFSKSTEADGLLRWFDEYTSRLRAGMYLQRPLMPDEPEDSRGISLFPASGADLSVCVTRGVEVRASCVYMPEHPAKGWGYSIALRLTGTAEERGFETCQLHTRTWLIAQDGYQPEKVNGEGVIGFFPILADGGWICNGESDPHGQYEHSGFFEGEFRYQSCSNGFPSMRGSFGGHLTFIPGTREKPTGRPFDVKLAPFKLYIPEYIY